MDSFESVIAMLLRRRGYWSIPSYKIILTKEEKRQIGRSSNPRWEVDVVAYKGSDNEILAIECKSLLDSRGVFFRNNSFDPPKRYKLFCDQPLRSIVLRRLAIQLEELGFCRSDATVKLCLARKNCKPD